MKNRQSDKNGCRKIGQLGRLTLVVMVSLTGVALAAQGATGDISSVSISADGAQVSFAVEGLDGAGITGIASGKSITLQVTSRSYTGTTPGTVIRSVPTLFRAASGASPAMVTLDLAEWVHVDDTNVTLSADAGALSDGVNASRSASNISATNGSTLDYPIPTVAVVSESLTKHTGPFYVDVYACGPAYSNLREQFGIAAVTVDVTDAAGTTKTKTATQMQLINRIGDYGWQSQWQAFRVGPFNPGNGGDWGSGGAAQGIAAIVAKAYPRVGDADSVRTAETAFVFLDKSNSYDVRHAVVNSSTGNNATGRIGTGDGGYWASVDQVGAAAKSNPFKDIQAALSACQRGDGTTAGPAHGKASWSVVYLAAGSHKLGDYQYGMRTDTRDGPAIITKLPSATRDSVVITGSPNSCGIRTNAIWLENLRIAATGNAVLRTVTQMYYPAGPLGDFEYLKIRNCDLIGTGRTDTTFTQWTDGFDKVLVYAISCSNAWTPLAAMRDSTYVNNGGTFAYARDHAVFVNNDISIDAAGTNLPADVLRFYGTAENVSFHNNLVRNIANVRPAPSVTGAGKTVRSFAMTMNVQSADGQAPYSPIGDVTCDSWFLYHNVWADRFEYRKDTASFAQSNMWVVRNVFADLATANDPLVTPTGHVQNHNMNPAGYLGGFNWTSGEDLVSLFNDWSAGDYGPKGAVLFSRWSDPMSPYDAKGVAMPSDGTGAIGALQNTSVVIADTTPPTTGTMPALPQYLRSGPVTITYSGVTDAGSGLAQVELWVRKNAGAWQATGLKTTTDAGSFAYSGFTGDGFYAFAIRTTDVAGNSSPSPSGAGTVSTTLDSTAPNMPALSVAAAVKSSPIGIGYSGATDGGSGLKSVALWVRKGTGAWTNSSLGATASSGDFQFAGTTGDATYYFAVVCEDNAGNTTAAVTGSGAAQTILDTVAPTIGGISGPSLTGTSPIAVSYLGIVESGSGLKLVTLWVKKDQNSWTATTSTSTAASGVFNYTPTLGSGSYIFAVVASDNAGNVSPAASSSKQTTVVYDVTAPIPGTLTAPAMSNTSPVALSYSGASDAGSGLQSVTLWSRKDAGAWASTGLSQTTASGTFNFAPSLGSGVYQFALVATDKAGISSATPSGTSAVQTTYDVDLPSAGTLTAPASATQTPFNISYSGAQDTLSGLKSVYLWYKKDSGTWTQSALSSTTASGTFSFTQVSGSGTYYFGLQSEDKAGNKSAVPSGNGLGSTAYAGSLQAGTATSPAYATAAPITVSYSGASAESGALKAVYLWYKKGATGTWTKSSLSATGASGSFNFTAVSGDATYYFATQAEDTAANVTAAPTGSGSTQTILDSTAPTLGTLTAPAMSNTAPLSISYGGIADAGSGLQSVALWAKKGTGAWAATSLTQSAASGTFSYSPTQGGGVYYLALVATDKAGVASPIPSGNGMAQVTYDVDPPAVGTLTAPASTTQTPIAVTYSGASDAVSGLKTVTLWYKKGTGAWTPSNQSATSASGTFSFSEVSGSATYYFALQAVDQAGNVSAAPSGSGLGSTAYTGALNAGTASAPAYASTAPITVSYSGAADGGAGLKAVYLWYKKGSGGTWTKTGQSAASSSGSFNFSAVSGDDTYYFATQVEEMTGAVTPAPTGSGTASTVYDTTPPNPGVAQAPKATNKLPVTISYSGVSDNGSGPKQVILWMKDNKGGAWTDTGLRSDVTPSGQFKVDGLAKDAKYTFFLQAEDKAGVKSPPPTEVMP